MNGKNGTDFLAGFLLGALASTALALLFAPQTGEETRQRIKEQSVELKGRAREIPSKAREGVEELTARGRLVLDKQVAQLEEAVSEGKMVGDKKVKELQARLDEARSGDQQAAETG
jgi:gas vesicle protein